MTLTKSTCSCGASIETAFTSELKEWLDRHQACIDINAKQKEPPVSIGSNGAIFWKGNQ